MERVCWNDLLAFCLQLYCNIGGNTKNEISEIKATDFIASNLKTRACLAQRLCQDKTLVILKM